METNPNPIPRLRTGVPGLDPLLGGGLIEGRTVLLKGAPGSGKTTLGLQILLAGATFFNEPGILLTFEQVPEQLYADMASFGWDLKKLAAEKKLQVIFVKPEEVLEAPGRQESRLLVNIADWTEDTGARRIMIDSISHLRHLFEGGQARAMLMRFLVQLKALGMTPVMTAELSPGEGLAGLDAYLIDTVIHLTQAQHSGGERRQLEILKTRGTHHVGGAHPFEIGPAGIAIYPHIAGAPEAAAGAAAPQTSGVPGLDPLLNGGATPGSTVIIAGLSGTFKTTLAMHMALSGGEGALWIGFHERAAALRRMFASRGAAGEGAGLEFAECEPGRDPVEKILLDAERLIRERHITRVVIDSMNELTAGIPGEAERDEAVRWLLRRLRALGVTTLLTQRLARVTGLNPLSEIAYAELADTIVYLGLVEIESRLEKVVSVLKHRGGMTEGDLRSIRATAQGLRVSDRFVGLSGVLAGTPLGRRKAQIEEIFQPLYFIRDFLTLAQDPHLESGQRSGILEQVTAETKQLIGLLGRYFDQPAPGADAPGQGD